MAQKWVEFRNGRAFSSAIDDFEIVLHGNAREIGRLDRERVRLGQAHISARERIVRASLDRVTRVTELTGQDHDNARMERIASEAQDRLSDTPTQMVIDGYAVWIARRAQRAVVWDAEDHEPLPPSPSKAMLVPTHHFEVVGKCRDIGRWQREEISFADWRDGEVVEAIIDGQHVKMRRAGWRIQVWGARDRDDLPRVDLAERVDTTGTLEDYEIVVDGDAVKIGRLDREAIRRDGQNHEEWRNDIVREALASMQADRANDGWRDRRKIDGIDCAIRRDGWRLQVWGAGESEPMINPRPAPPGADAPGPEAPSARVRIADFDVKGRPFAPTNDDNSPETQQKRLQLLQEIGDAERAGDDAKVKDLQRRFVATYKKSDA